MYYQTANPHGGDVYAGDQVVTDFSACCNPLGTPPGVLTAARVALAHADRYPDPFCRALVRAVAACEGVPEDFVLCGNGSSELIYAFCAAVRPKRAVELAPTFSEYSAALAGQGCPVTRYALHPETDFALDEGILTFLEDERPEVVFLCTPNNPTGRLIPPKLLERIVRFCEEKCIRLFLDVCFLDLSDGESVTALLDDAPGLFLLNAFTKTWGMAGLRLGWCLSGDAALLRRMSELSPPWNVSGPAQAAGIAALSEQAYLRKAKALIKTEKAFLTAELRRLGLRVCPSEANFLLFRGPAGLREALLARGVLIRDCANFPGLCPGWYRIAVRLREENERLLALLREVL